LAEGSKTQRGPASHEFFASCAQGAEKVLAAELTALNMRRVRPLSSGVAFFGSLTDGLRACLWLRCASRVLLILGRVDAASAEQLYEGVRALAWEDHLSATGTLAVDAHGVTDELRDTRFIALKVKDAICDRLRERFGVRPSVARERPDVRVNVSVRGQRATIALDLAGEPLHRRGYRVESPAISAPLRETLAATMLLSAPLTSNDERSVHSPQGRLGVHSPQGRRTILDPMCGSGTLVIEAALLASDRAPGLLRDYWGFERWLGFDAAVWQSLLDEADERAAVGSAALSAAGEPCVLASDIDSRAVEVSRAAARKAGVIDLIDFSVSDVAALAVPESASELLLVTNPPYGERLETAAQLPALYAALAGFFKRATALAPTSAVVITPDDRIDAFLGEPASRIETRNGPLEAAIRIYPSVGAAPSRVESDISTPSHVESDTLIASPPMEQQLFTPSRGEPNALEESEQVSPYGGETGAPVLEPSPFTNRLRKMATHRAKWARRTGVSCYRVYDADLPDYKVAIDLYQGATGTPDEGGRWLHVAEYAAPSEIDPQRAAERLAEVLRAAPEILNVDTRDVFCKRRERSKGGSQYALNESNEVRHVVRENGLIFEIDLASRLDTGLFLDHRMTRQLLRERAKGLDCLNLFAYTGTASVAMAAGGARSVTTLDLSRTYLDWAKLNMMRNGFTGAAYACEQADVLRWVDEQRHPGREEQRHRGREEQRHRGREEQTAQRYGLVFVDVPTFSNSERMGKRSWDVQRDHAELLIGVSRLLAPGGVAVFSTNLRSFQIDCKMLAKAHVEAKDITASTIPPDFERTTRMHQCYLITRTVSS
jgi:23S rRNA (guanine2445-N2)-methyltransferase / 23S rRNA (guanine2069-N7)-methyltransferase